MKRPLPKEYSFHGGLRLGGFETSEGGEGAECNEDHNIRERDCPRVKGEGASINRYSKR